MISGLRLDRIISQLSIWTAKHLSGGLQTDVWLGSVLRTLWIGQRKRFHRIHSPGPWKETDTEDYIDIDSGCERICSVYVGDSFGSEYSPEEIAKGEG